jgi:hypothetical protein
MKTLLLVSVAFVLSTAAANAETFTFTSKAVTVAQVGGPGPGGKPVGASHATNEAEVVWASGTKMKSKGDCMSWSAPPGSGFTGQGMCNGTDADGAKTFMVFSCAGNDKNTENDCWGRLTYTSGKNQGKVATASWHGKQNADGKGGTAAGAGTMN